MALQASSRVQCSFVYVQLCLFFDHQNFCRFNPTQPNSNPSILLYCSPTKKETEKGRKEGEGRKEESSNPFKSTFPSFIHLGFPLSLSTTSNFRISWYPSTSLSLSFSDSPVCLSVYSSVHLSIERPAGVRPSKLESQNSASIYILPISRVLDWPTIDNVSSPPPSRRIWTKDAH